jgi:predicted nuclease of predicted toxin-antitoxin system
MEIKEVRLFLDMNLSVSLRDLIVELGFDATHASDIFRENRIDDKLIEYASRNRLIMVTYDLKMRKVHEAAFKEFNASAIFISTTIHNKKLDFQIEWYKTYWTSHIQKNELPRSKLRGICRDSVVEQRQLRKVQPIVLARSPLILDVVTNHLFATMTTDTVDEKTATPKSTTPEPLLHGGNPKEYLTSRQALNKAGDSGGAVRRNRLNQKMHMIQVCADL